jgi:tetratricopeptide (TPR) repeat protein
MPDLQDQLASGLRHEKAGMFDAALATYKSAVALAIGPEERAEVLIREASAHRGLCDWEAALAAARSAEKVAREASLARWLGEALNFQGIVHQLTGDFEKAEEFFQAVLESNSGDRVRGLALQNLGSIAAQTSNLELAERRFSESADCFRSAGYAWGEAFALNNQAAVALDRGQVEDAVRIGERAVAAARLVNDLELLGIASLNHAEALAGMGQLDEAEEMAGAANGIFVASKNTLRRVNCLRLLGDIRVRLGDPDTAARCYNIGVDLAREVGARRELEELTRKLAEIEPSGEGTK